MTLDKGGPDRLTQIYFYICKTSTVDTLLPNMGCDLDFTALGAEP